jgi:GNAT superfamily N-acetyltransferase
VSPPATVVELTAAQTHPLRGAVLRSDTPSRDVRFPEDDLPGTVHLGVEVDGELVAVSTWVSRRHPDHAALDGVQVRGMATAPEVRGQGYGGLVLERGIERAAAGGAELVWARARDTALAFYERHGFTVFGRGYVDLTTQLPHHDIIRRL